MRDEIDIMVGRMDLEQAPRIEEVDQTQKFLPEVPTKYTEVPYFYQKKIDPTLITLDAVCVADSVNRDENHRVVNAIKDNLQRFASEEVRRRESQFVGYSVYDKGRLVTEFEWDSKSANNMIVAIFQRHLSSRVTPCVQVIDELALAWNRKLQVWV